MSHYVVATGPHQNTKMARHRAHAFSIGLINSIKILSQPKCKEFEFLGVTLSRSFLGGAPQYWADEVVSLFYPRWGTSSVHASYAPEFPVGMAGRSQHGGIDIGLRYVVATKVAIPKPK
jgi:hypothetical protein